MREEVREENTATTERIVVDNVGEEEIEEIATSDVESNLLN